MALFASGTAYDAFMGRYSTQLAPAFADFSGITADMSVVDVGAGTGALAAELAARGARVAAADPSPPFAEALRARLPASDVRLAPAEELPWPDGSFDAALAQLVVAFMKDAPGGVAEMRRVVRTGGTVAACMWDRDGMEMLAAVSRAQRALASAGPAPESGVMYREQAEIEGLFADGFADIVSAPLEVESTYSDFAEFWDALSGGVGPAGAWIASLDGEARDAARGEVERQLGSPAGQFTLRARAWATRATCA
jgi:ubiquinone/menaquinone biosynthesis C-methylase UbiE